mmetsp:Transcript_7378/g.23285  ORF Transcript_7378/g.23285 Transcript_7378/m.23285 type:complete len:320 (-) Transcript_7378:13-972(-)
MARRCLARPAHRRAAQALYALYPRALTPRAHWRSRSSRSTNEMQIVRISPVANHARTPSPAGAPPSGASPSGSSTALRSMKRKAECVAMATSRSGRARSHSISWCARSHTAAGVSRSVADQSASSSGPSAICEQSSCGKSRRRSSSGLRASHVCTPICSRAASIAMNGTVPSRCVNASTAVLAARLSGDVSTSCGASARAAGRSALACCRPSAVSGGSHTSGRTYGLLAERSSPRAENCTPRSRYSSPSRLWKPWPCRTRWSFQTVGDAARAGSSARSTTAGLRRVPISPSSRRCARCCADSIALDACAAVGACGAIDA